MPTQQTQSQLTFTQSHSTDLSGIKRRLFLLRIWKLFYVPSVQDVAEKPPGWTSVCSSFCSCVQQFILQIFYLFIFFDVRSCGTPKHPYVERDLIQSYKGQLRLDELWPATLASNFVFWWTGLLHFRTACVSGCRYMELHTTWITNYEIFWNIFWRKQNQWTLSWLQCLWSLWARTYQSVLSASLHVFPLGLGSVSTSL